MTLVKATLMSSPGREYSENDQEAPGTVTETRHGRDRERPEEIHVRRLTVTEIK